MSITSINELRERDGTWTSKGETKYSRTYRVEVSDPDHPAFWILASFCSVTGINLFDHYSAEGNVDLGASITNISATCESDDGKSWIVKTEYAPIDPEQKEDDNPLHEPIEISWSFNNRTKLIERDIYGNAIVNSALSPFADPVEIDDPRPVLNIKRNETQYPVSLVYQYRNAVNSDSFFGAEAGQVKVMSISSSRQYNAKYGYYWQTSYNFEFCCDEGGWHKSVLDMGFKSYGKIDDDPQVIANRMAQGVRGLQNINDKDGKPVQVPHPLNGHGLELPHPLDVYPPYVFLDFVVYPELPFSVFHF